MCLELDNFVVLSLFYVYHVNYVLLINKKYNGEEFTARYTGGWLLRVELSAVKVSGEGDEFAPVHADDMQYTDAKSYVMLEMCLHRPLVHKRDTEELAQR